jgi:hypothetical protein
MQPFLEPCLLGAIQYLTTQLKISPPETITPYVEILSTLLDFVSPVQQEDDLFSAMPLELKTSRVLQILAPSMLRIISRLTVHQVTPAQGLIDSVVETLQPYGSQFRPDPPLEQNKALASLRGALLTLAQWSSGSESGFLVPPDVDMRCVGAAVQSCGGYFVVRHIVHEMWMAERDCGYHAGLFPFGFYDLMCSCGSSFIFNCGI